MTSTPLRTEDHNMRLLRYQIAVLLVGSAFADLTCLKWAVVSTVYAAFCYLKPEVFGALENNTVTAIESTLSSLKQVAIFDISHSPIGLSYNYINTAETLGVQKANEQLKSEGRDFWKVNIGFGKETANQAVQILDLLDWNDVSWCLINGAINSSRTAAAKSQMAMGLVTAQDAIGVAGDCLSRKLNKPPVFNITDPTQKIGATMSDIASLLVPIEGEAAAANDVAKSGHAVFDLAVPGSEDTTRVFSTTGPVSGANGLTVGKHFESAEEATKVAKSMKDPEWVNKYCEPCKLPRVLSVRAISKRSPHRLSRRTGLPGWCCDAIKSPFEDPASFDGDIESAAPILLRPEGAGPSSIEDGLVGLEMPEPEVRTHDIFNQPIYDQSKYKIIAEDKVRKDIVYPVRDTVAEVVGDLEKSGTSVIKFSPEMNKALSSDQMLEKSRGVFEGDGTLLRAVKGQQVDGKLRLFFDADHLLVTTNPELETLRQWAAAYKRWATDVVVKLKDLTEEETESLYVDIAFLYTPPSERAALSVDPRGFHLDEGLMAFGIADVPGLVILDPITGEASRPPLVKGAAQMIPGQNLASFPPTRVSQFKASEAPLEHAAFGPDMAKTGRLSVIGTVKSTYFQPRRPSLSL